ncbi:hypothetical protein [Desulfoplanes formicivorans]|uniref:VOC domain-containing protein n=1 Tax=Desulfoplanes formicivorans TaxID=1592317 RepID=A0A194AHW1_9BACT|nr:hypothetical protein [Desulfoplanes formicivorans]GAU08913.1 hypothetical protein DPF_1632 [Desulfoplanes formicivorans]
MSHEHINTDERLLEQVDQVKRQRRQAGLSGLVGGLECVIINTEENRFEPAVKELLRYTGLDCSLAFQDTARKVAVLQKQGSADFLITSGKPGVNPFAPFNQGPKSAHLPNTRLETLVFRTKDLAAYVDIQKKRGKQFMTEEIIRAPHFSFIQSRPSPYTGNSLGFIEWHTQERNYMGTKARSLDISFAKPDLPHLAHIGRLDHCATRVRAEERDKAILEFMDMTEYDFEFAIYVESLNSITNVARLRLGEFAMVFTSGIAPFTDVDHSGPTELYIHNYGTRVHHMAFETDHIETTFQALKKDGMGFLVDLVGSPDQGLKQTFSAMSPNTLLVNEYIHRYGDFTGFFTKSNVTMLTKATEKQ